MRSTRKSPLRSGGHAVAGLIVVMLASLLGPTATLAADPSATPSPFPSSSPGTQLPPPPARTKPVTKAAQLGSTYYAEDDPVMTRVPACAMLWAFTGFPNANGGAVDVYGGCGGSVSWQLTGPGTVSIHQFDNGHATLSIDGTAVGSLWGGCFAGNIQLFPVTGAGTHTFRIDGFSDDYSGCQYASWAFDGIDWAPAASAAPSRFAGAGPNPHQRNPTGAIAEPVNTWSGNYTSEVTDLTLPGRGLPFAFTRQYNSLGTTDGPLGPGWTDSYAASLTPNADGSVTFRTESGSQLPYQPDGSGGFVSPAGAFSVLAQVSGGYTVTRKDGLVYSFDAAGKLTSEVDRNGNALSFAYANGDLSAITDTVGRVLGLTYDATHHLETIADPTGRAVTYAYDGTGHLATVTDVRGGLTTYGYDASGRLATITDQNGHVLVTNTYDSSGRVIDQADARGNHTTFTWDSVAQTCTVIDPRGGTTVDTYSGPMLMSRRDALGDVTTFGYDAVYDRTSISDARSNTTAMTYDGRGNLLTRTAPAPLSYLETWTYNSLDEPLSHQDGRGATTTYTYDAAGNILTATGPAPISPVATNTYDPSGHGLLISITDTRGKSTAFGYDAQANRNRITSPLGEITTLTYDGAGRVLTTVDPLGNATGGNPAEHTTTFVHDAANSLTSATDPLGHVTSTTFDPAGNQMVITDPNDHTTSFAYDAANHLTSVTDATQHVTAYAYDTTGNLTSRTDANGHTTTYTYSLAGRLTATSDPASHVASATYDPTGNVATSTDANGNTTTYTYDELNRPIGTTYADPSTPSVAIAYDPNGNRTSMSDGAGTETSTFDPLNRLTATTRGTDGFAYTFDAAGNILTRTYPDGSVTTYTYDDDGRLRSATFPAGLAPDTTAPSVPNGLSATAVGASQVDLAWTASTDAVGVQGYKIYRNGTYLSSIGPVGSASFSDTGLTSGTTYIYRVTAIDAAGNESAQSGTATATPGDTSAPTVPTALTVTPTNWHVMTVSWTSSNDNVGVTKYNVYRGGTLLAVTSGTTTGLVDRSVAPSTSYGYSVRACDGAGNCSAQTATSSQTTPGLTHVQDAGAQSTASTTLAVTLGTAPLAGDALVATVTTNATTRTVSSISGAGGTWSRITAKAASGGNTETWAALDVAGGSTTVTITLSSSGAGAAIVTEVGGVASSGATDVSGSASGANTRSLASGTVTTTNATDLLVAVAGYRGTTSITTNPASPWTTIARQTNTTLTNSTAWQTATTSGSKSASWTLSANTSGYDGNIVALKASTTGPADTTAPTVPAAPSPTVISSTQINLSWTASSDVIGVQGYRIYRNGTQVGTVPVSGTTFSDTGLAPATSYSYTLAAVDGAGNASAQSSAAARTTLGPDSTPPTVPTGVGATASTANLVNVTWTASTDTVGVTRYSIFRDGTLLSVVAASVTTLTDRSTSGSTTYSYTVTASDAAGNVSAASSPAGVTTPAAVGASAQATYTYDPAGDVTAVVTSDGVTERATYDRAGRLLEIANTETGGTLSRFTYGLDAVGNRLEQTTNIGTTYYGYDALDRLTGACTGGTCVPGGAAPLPCLACVTGTIGRSAASVTPNPADLNTTYAYDPVGNRLTSVNYQGTTTSAYDTADRLTSMTPPGGSAVPYTYDANGNELTAGSATYTYDFAGRMHSATVGTTTATYAWSGDGIRLSSSTEPGVATTNFLVDRAFGLPQVALERDGTGTIVTRSAYGLSRLALTAPSFGTLFEHPDPLGSVTDLTSASGASLAWSDFAPFGAIRTSGSAAGSPTDPFGFAGQYLDSTGLYYMRARQYDPATGRFLSIDPASPSITDLHAAGYVYGRDDPVNLIDASGKDPLCAPLLFGVEFGPIDWVAAVACVGVTALVIYAAGNVGNLAKATLDQKQGQVIPQLKPMPQITQPFRPKPPVIINPYTNDIEPPAPGGGPSGSGGPSRSGRPWWLKVGAAAAAAAILGSVLLGDNQK